MHIFLGDSGPGGTDLETLQGWILKFGEDSKRLGTSVEISIDWLANGSPPWAAYHSFMSGLLIEFDKQPDVHPVGVRENWRRLFAKIVIKVTVPEATIACRYDQLCAGLKAGIDGAVHGVQAIWDENSTTEDWGFLLVDKKNSFNEINRVKILWKV